jgi:hypothetical protein
MAENLVSSLSGAFLNRGFRNADSPFFVALYTGNCSNCNCANFRLTLSAE